MIPTHDPTFSVARIAATLDHALLHPTLSDDELRAELEGLRAYPIATVCIKPPSLPLAVEMLRGTSIGVGTVIGFPHGTQTSAIKVAETAQAFAEGAHEVDMVVNTGKVLSGDFDYVRRDIEGVVQETRAHGGRLKVIFETGFLTRDADKIHLCEICSELGADWVKTSTGFGFVKQPDGHFSAPGAQDADLILMRKHCAPHVGVKASGGMRTLADVLRVLPLGVSRIGTTSTHAILSAARERFEGQSEALPAATSTQVGY